MKIPGGRGLTRTNPTILIVKKKAVIPMQYEGFSALEVLEDVKKKLSGRVETAEKVLRQTQSNISDMKNTICNIDDFLEDERLKARPKKKLDPANCMHVNKKLDDSNGHAETVTCEDCGLMLSYKVI